MAGEDCCTVLITQDKFQVPQLSEIQADLESKDEDKKIAAVKTVIQLILNGEDQPRLLMHVIRFCVTSENHELKKVLMYYWEVVNKYDEDGKLRAEMILVCNALRNDLVSPNEYIRGGTLRFLAHIDDQELLQPLISSVTENLSHRHAFVRRNAVMAVYSIYRKLPELMPDAPQDILTFLEEEADPIARRNAFLMLFNSAEDLAIKHFLTVADDIKNQGEGVQLVTLELARKVCRSNPQHKGKFVGVIFDLLQSTNAAVAFEAAETLVSLSTAPTAIRAAAAAFCQLLVAQSDNNVKLIVLDRLAELKTGHTKVLREVVMDILRALATPDSDIRKKTLAIALDLVTARNVEEVVGALKKEVTKMQDSKEDKDSSYRTALVETINACVVRFPDVAESVVTLLLDFITTGKVALQVIKFVREVTQAYPGLRPAVLGKLMEVLPEVTSKDVMRVCVWIIGEYCEEWEQIEAGLRAIHECVGSMPLLDAHTGPADADEDEDDDSATASGAGAGAGAKGPVVLADGTYATQSAGADEDSPASKDAKKAPTLPMREAIVGGDYFLAAVLASALTKLALRTIGIHGASTDGTKGVVVDAMLVMCAILELGESKKAASKIDQDSQERIALCLRVLAVPEVQSAMRPVMLMGCREVFDGLVQAKRTMGAEETKDEVKAQADDLITVRQLRGTAMAELATLGLDDEADIIKATGTTKENFASRLRRVHQLTGYGDPVYAEAVVLAHDFDISLDITVLNRTDDTLTNLSAELATVGDLKLVDHPASHTVAPHSSVKIKAAFKVSSLESAHIYGTIVFNTSKTTDKKYINMSDIHVDIMDYIHPATCSDARFREMWAEFEWENKIAVSTDITDLRQFLDHVAKITNTSILTPEKALEGECDFLVANLYGRSTFGEDAIANLSVQKYASNNKIHGHIRIRSKTQGVALSLGDRMTQKMKALDSADDSKK